MKYWTLLIYCAGLVSCGSEASTPTTTTMPDTPSAIEAIAFDHFALLVSDLGRAATFYQEVIGLREIENATQQKHIRWFSLGGERSLHLIESTDAATLSRHKSVHLALTVADLDSFMKKMHRSEQYFENWQGVADSTNLRPDGVAQIYFQDPDGYWIEVNDAAAFR